MLAAVFLNWRLAVELTRVKFSRGLRLRKLVGGYDAVTALLGAPLHVIDEIRRHLLARDFYRMTVYFDIGQLLLFAQAVRLRQEVGPTRHGHRR